MSFTPVWEPTGVYAAAYQPAPKRELDLHTHGFLEMVLVLSGRGRHCFGRSGVPMEAGDVIFVNNQRPHELEALTDDCEMVVIAFLPSAAGFDDALLRKYDLVNYYPLLVPFHALDEKESFATLHPEKKLFKKLLFHAFHLCELTQKEAGKKSELAKRLLIDILYLLDSHPRKEDKGRSSTSLPLQGVLSHLHEHFREPGVLKKLVDVCGMSPSYFSTVFTRVMGRGPLRFVTELRIREAERLLKETRLPIREICVNVGYEHPSNFSRAFKSITGKNPKSRRPDEK